MSLGSAFLKVNFLRDLKADHDGLNRSYFPNLNIDEFDEPSKKIILDEIDKDFRHALKGIFKLPSSARFGVYTAYKYYLKLLNKLRKTHPLKIKSSRINPVANIPKPIPIEKNAIDNLNNVGLPVFLKPMYEIILITTPTKNPIRFRIISKKNSNYADSITVLNKVSEQIF